MGFRAHMGLAERLMMLGLGVTLLLIGAGGYVLHFQLHQAILRGVAQQADAHTARIAMSFHSDGGRLVQDTDVVSKEFQTIFSGWYWQLQDGSRIERSRSLWDSTLPLAQARMLSADLGVYQLSGPVDEVLLGVHHAVVLDGREMVLHVYVPGAATLAELARIDRIVLVILSAMGVMLLLAMAWQVRMGLRPLRRLRKALRDVHDGVRSRAGSGYGADLDPLADTIDEVLARNARVVARARNHSADLSHALKKPLVLLAAGGEAVSAAQVQREVANMHRLIERHLARAGSGAGDVRRIDLYACLRDLLALMQRLHQERGLVWQLDAPEKVYVRAEQTDVEEMLGNLLDNAGKWAKSRVVVRVCKDALDAVVIEIADDGMGMDDEEMSHAKQRGQRFDESRDGSGLGLTIATDIAQTYEGSVELGRSRLGGLLVTLRLPV